MEKPQTFADITPQHIQDWKAKRGSYALSVCSVDVSEGVTAKFVLAAPDQKTFIAISENKNPADANRILLANCVLGGDLDFLEKDGQVFATVLSDCAGLLKRKPSTLKKL